MLQQKYLTYFSHRPNSLAFLEMRCCVIMCKHQFFCTVPQYVTLKLLEGSRNVPVAAFRWTYFRWMVVHNWRGNTYSRNIIEVFLNWNCSYFPKFEISAPSSFLHFNENVMFGCAQTRYVYGKCKAIANSRPGDTTQRARNITNPQVF